MDLTFIAFYLRISFDRSGEALGVDRQLTSAHKLVEFHQITGEIREYLEPGSLSASKPRPAESEYGRLVQDARAGRIKILIVWDIDRLTRIPREIEDWLDLCEKQGLRIITMDGECDTASANGRMFLRIKAAVARHEVEHKSARQKAAHVQRRERGKPWFARRPFGYNKDGTLRDGESTALQGVYAAIAAGDHNLTHHAKRLNDNGWTGTSGAAWTGSSLRQALLADRNLGGPVMDWFTWSALVDEDTFHLVRRVLRNPARTSGGRSPIAQMTGIAQCDVCGGHIGIGHLSSAPRPGGYYICTKSRHISHPRDLVDAYIDELVIESMADPEVLALWATVPAEELTVMRDDLVEIERRMTEITEDYADGSMTRDQFRIANARLKERHEVAAYARATATTGSPLDGLDEMGPAAWWANLPLHHRRAVLQRLEVRLRYRGRGNRTWNGERDVVEQWRGVARSRRAAAVPACS